MSDTGQFQINSVVLNIPPEQIQVSRQSANNSWQTLRTSSSIKSKSGYSILDIVVKASFTTERGIDGTKEQNGLQQLRDLIAQLRVTPFCYVENQFLRNSIMGGSSSPSMVLAIRQIQITKDVSSTNRVNVIFYFSWFNYFPYLREWAYKKDFFSPLSETNPIRSEPWHYMWYAQLQKTGQDSYHMNHGLKETQDVVMSYPEYTTITVQKYENLRQDVSKLLKLTEEFSLNSNAGNTEQPINVAQLKKDLTGHMGEGGGVQAFEAMFGTTTSQIPEKIGNAELVNLLKSTALGTTDSIYAYVNSEIWNPVINRSGNQIVHPSDPQTTFKDGWTKDDTVLLMRQRTLGSGGELIITGVNISFENVLAVIPMAGQPYPTYQHVGSIDAEVNLSIVCTTERALVRLSDFYSLVEDQAVKFRQVPQGHRNINLQNMLVNMCGLRYFIPNSLTPSTVPGQPGTYNVALSLVNNPLDLNTREDINPGQSLFSRTDIRNKIAEAIIKHLGYDTREREFAKDIGALNDKPSLIPYVDAAKVLIKGAKLAKETVKHVASGGKESRYYYVSKDGTDRDAAFAYICNEFGRHYGELRDHLLKTFEDSKTDIKVFYSLKNSDVPGVETMQDHLFSSVKYSSRLKQYLGNPKNPDQARKIAEAAMSRARNVAADELKRIQEIKRKDAFTRFKDHFTMNDITDRVNQKNLDLQTEYLDRAEKYIVEELNDWLSFVILFLDKIMYSGQIFLPQFKDALALLDEMMAENTGNCYPDFPLSQVVELMRTSDEHSQVKVFEKELKDTLKGSDDLLKNVGISALIQPDFYMYNAVNDDLGTVIPAEYRKDAVDGLLNAQQEARVKSEETWMMSEYEPIIIGDDIAKKISRDATNDDFDTGFWESSKEKNLKKAVQNLHSQPGRVAGMFNINDLVDVNGTSGLGCSILTEGDLELKGIGVGNMGNKPGHLILRDRPDKTSLESSDHHSKAKHYFGANSIQPKPDSAYFPDKLKPYDPNKDPDWISPVDNGMKVTSTFGLRTDPVKQDGSKQKHLGIDFAGIGDSTGLPVRAAARGIVIKASTKAWVEGATDNDDNSIGNFIKVQHANGYTTRYAHLDWDDETIEVCNKFHTLKAKGQTLEVSKNDIIGRIGKTGKRCKGAHLHFEVGNKGTMIDPLTVPDLAAEISTNCTYTKKLVNKNGYMSNRIILNDGKNQGMIAGFATPGESILTKSIEQLERDIADGQGYSLMRAYPTFRLYFIESDLGERKRYQFDDFFSYSSVSEIQVIRSRKIAADLAMITLTNISGNLTNKRFRDVVDFNKPRDETGKVTKEELNRSLASTKKENPIASLMLQPGIQIQLRMGYSANPEDLETVMNGVITNVVQHGTDDVITITCQSFGIELVQSQHGDIKTFGGFLNSSGVTGKLLEELLALPDVAHFGRWDGGKGYNSAYGLLRSEWEFVPSPADDNIFAPGGRGIWGLFDSTPKYTLYQSTIWDVFQEMTLRHPAYVAYPVPYRGKFGPRMTMFFGVPDQMYFAREPTFREDNVSNTLTRFVKNSFKSLSDEDSSALIEEVKDPNKSATEVSSKLIKVLSGDTSNIANKEAKLFWLRKQIKKFALDRGIVRPFRSYHVLTSTQHIISNNIDSTSNVFNTVTLQYGDNPAKVEKGQLVFGDLETFTLRSDAAVQDEEVKEMFAQYPNCVGYEMAKRYAVGLLNYSLKENYTGSIVIIGNPKIKPHDICYIFDEYSDMFGPIEVEQVVHKFSQRHGFITEITPDLVVHVNQETTMSTSDAMGLMAEVALKKMGLRSLPSIQTATDTTSERGVSELIGFSPIANMFFNSSSNAMGQKTSSSVFPMIGAFIFRKLITRTQLAHPFRYSPLTRSGNAMVGGLPIKKNKGSFIAGIRKWVREAEEGAGLLITDTYESLQFDNWVGVSQGSLSNTFWGRNK